MSSRLFGACAIVYAFCWFLLGAIMADSTDLAASFGVHEWMFLVLWLGTGLPLLIPVAAEVRKGGGDV